MCYPCANCGDCENSRVKSYYTCPLCGYVNQPEVSRCEQCGFVFPPLPGMTIARGLEAGKKDNAF